MSTSFSKNDWRDEAIHAMEHADPAALEHEISRRQEQNWLFLMIVKLTLVGVLTFSLVWFGGFAWFFALILVTWLLFWPR